MTSLATGVEMDEVTESDLLRAHLLNVLSYFNQVVVDSAEMRDATVVTCLEAGVPAAVIAPLVNDLQGRNTYPGITTDAVRKIRDRYYARHPELKEE